MAIIDRGETLYDKVGCYWLLDDELAVRQAAVAAFGLRMQAGRLDAALASTFILVRPWLPEDDAHKAQDAIMRDAMKREVSGGAAPTAWKLHRILTSLLDDAGAQSFAIAAQSGGRRVVAMILIREAAKITDPCSDISTLSCSATTYLRR